MVLRPFRGSATRIARTFPRVLDGSAAALAARSRGRGLGTGAGGPGSQVRRNLVHGYLNGGLRPVARASPMELWYSEDSTDSDRMSFCNTKKIVG